MLCCKQADRMELVAKHAALKSSVAAAEQELAQHGANDPQALEEMRGY